MSEDPQPVNLSKTTGPVPDERQLAQGSSASVRGDEIVEVEATEYPRVEVMSTEQQQKQKTAAARKKAKPTRRPASKSKPAAKQPPQPAMASVSLRINDLLDPTGIPGMPKLAHSLCEGSSSPHRDRLSDGGALKGMPCMGVAERAQLEMQMREFLIRTVKHSAERDLRSMTNEVSRWFAFSWNELGVSSSAGFRSLLSGAKKNKINSVTVDKLSYIAQHLDVVRRILIVTQARQSMRQDFAPLVNSVTVELDRVRVARDAVIAIVLDRAVADETRRQASEEAQAQQEIAQAKADQARLAMLDSAEWDLPAESPSPDAAGTDLVLSSQDQLPVLRGQQPEAALVPVAGQQYAIVPDGYRLVPIQSRYERVLGPLTRMQVKAIATCGAGVMAVAVIDYLT